MSDLHHQHQTNYQSTEHLDPSIEPSELLPQKKEVYDKFIQTLERILPHLGKDETKIISALIILALKLEGLIGKDLTEQDSKLIELLKECILNDDDRKTAALKIAERFNKPK